MEAKKILIGVPSAREDDRFLASVNNLVKQMKDKYQVSLLFEKWQNLPDAQNHIIDYFLSRDFDYVLFLDDDHWGHTVEMVDALVKADAMMVTMKSYVRYYPYISALFNRGEGNKYYGIESDFDYEKVDMTGFPMTLIKTELFNKLERPYFRAVEGNGRNWHTDVEFCERIGSVGIKPMGCFRYCLPHAEVTQENVVELREKHPKTFGDRLLAHYSIER